MFLSLGLAGKPPGLTPELSPGRKPANKELTGRSRNDSEAGIT